MNAAAAAVVVLNGRQAFDPRASLFAHNEPGFWYDPSDLSSMYQDSAGTTPVTAVEQAVGLILDKSRGLVLGPELVTNGDFSGGTTGWTASNSALTVVSGALRVTNNTGGAASPRAYQAVVFTLGRTYQITGTIPTQVGGGVGLGLNNAGDATVTQVIGTVTATGAFSFLHTVTAAANSFVVRTPSNVGDAAFFDIDNISVREIAGNHAIQPSSTSRPTLRARYNLLTFSEQFDNAAWTKTALNGAISANATTAPDGTLTADLYTEDSALAQRAILQTVAVLPGTHTQYVSAKNNGRRYVSLYPQGVGTAWAIFDLQTGAVSATGGANIAGSSITAQANGFYRCSVSVTVAAAGNLLPHVYLTDSNSSPAPGYTGDGVSGVFIWGADMRRSSDTYLPYQRIEAATDYDTVGFPVYLAFDGSDDSLYTGGNVDFSGTDKMTVWAGVTKLSDAARGIVVELTAGVPTNNGSFNVNAPYTAAADYGVASKGTNAADITTAASFASPHTSVLTMQGDIGGDNLIVRVNAVESTPNTNDQGTGNYANAPLYIGRRNNASLPFNGRLFQLIGRGAATSAALIAQAERWVAGKQGRAL